MSSAPLIRSDYTGISYSGVDSADESGGRLRCANIFYTILLLIVSVLCFFLYNTDGGFLKKVIKTSYTEAATVGIASVVRTTASLAIWFALHAVLLIANPNLEDSWQFNVHTRWLPVHALIFVVLWVAFWFIPDPFYDVYMRGSIYVSALYIAIQIVMLIDFFMILNERWVNEEREHLALAVTCAFGAVTLIAFGVGYYLFATGNCTGNAVILSVNLALSIALFIAAFLIPHGSILTAALVAAYVAFLTLSGMICQAQCSKVAASKQGIGFSIAASIFAITWAAYSAFSSTSQFAACGVSREEGIFSLSFFHTLMGLAAVYLTMVVTHWGDTTDVTPPWMTDRGHISRWVNFAGAWFTMVLFAWTLAAPYILRDREF